MDEFTEAGFQLLVGDGGPKLERADDLPKSRGTPPARMASEEAGQRGGVCKPTDLSLVDRRLEVAARDDRGKVEEGAGHRCDRYPLMPRDLIALQVGAVEVDAASGVEAAVDGHVYPGSRRRQHSHSAAADR